MEVAARREFSLEVATEQGYTWDVASLLEENRVGHDIAESSLMNLSMRQHKLGTQLTALPHGNAKGAGVDLK